MKEPDFYVVGTQKGGTTALHEYLCLNKSIYLPEIKETKWFVLDERYEKGWDYYLKTHFLGVKEGQVVGEIDPDVMYFPEAFERLKKHVDLASKKFIFVLRDPAKRAFSQYLMTFRRGYETSSFDEALLAERGRLGKGDYFHRQHFSYADRGFYSHQIQPYLDAVPRDRILFIKSDELKNNAHDVLKRVCDFVGADVQFDLEDFKPVHQAQRPKNAWLTQQMASKSGVLRRLFHFLCPVARFRKWLWFFMTEKNLKNASEQSMSKEAQAALNDRYKDELLKLSVLTGLDLSGWCVDEKGSSESNSENG